MRIRFNYITALLVAGVAAGLSLVSQRVQMVSLLSTLWTISGSMIALALYQRLGLKGIKVDFMDRNDQDMVDFYHRVMEETAKRRLLVNMHSAYPPAGLNRTYPNFLTQEGVMGAEYNKWGNAITSRPGGRVIQMSPTRSYGLRELPDESARDAADVSAETRASAPSPKTSCVNLLAR